MSWRDLLVKWLSKFASVNLLHFILQRYELETVASLGIPEDCVVFVERFATCEVVGKFAKVCPVST